MVTFRAIGDWSEGCVSVEQAADTRQRLPDVEAAIEREWAAASARLGSRLFDGPMCRLERFEATSAALRLRVSPTSYMPFLGTNLSGADCPPEALANPLGLSAALTTSDGFLLLGRRNANVAYYPNRIHPFAGSLEPGEASNVFDGVRRELEEELRLTRDDLTELRCLGLIEDADIRQPELIFEASAIRSRREIEATLDDTEHHACVAVAAERAAVEATARDPLMTPVAVGTLLLWGRILFGDDWFSGQRARISTGGSS